MNNLHDQDYAYLDVKIQEVVIYYIKSGGDVQKTLDRFKMHNSQLYRYLQRIREINYELYKTQKRLREAKRCKRQKSIGL
jgi:predicted RNase H-like nuclease (RuvC/YqgF family)